MGTLSDRRRWVRAARFILYGVAVLAAVLGSAALFLPDLLDTPPVRAEIQRRLASAFHADLAWESLRVRILPWPHGTLSKFRIDKPGVGKSDPEAERLEVPLV